MRPKSRLVESGDIYKGTHSGWYSVSDESFYSASQVKQLDDGKMVALESENEVVWEEEDNWKFRLPRYRDRLLEWINREDCKSRLSRGGADGEQRCIRIVCERILPRRWKASRSYRSPVRKCV